jgi:DNA invertase Pin-like site-specific DNA recombinase
MVEAAIYTRVSSREQQQEGFSLFAQSRILNEYAQQRGLRIVRSFEDVETAKRAGRRQFSKMVDFYRSNRQCRVLLVEKTDRISRNFHDAVTLEDLDIEIHFVKEGQIISKESKSQATLVYGFNLVLARHYSNNLREEVKKGMREKAARGVFPGYAPFGYRNNRGDRTIEPDPVDAPLVCRIFDLYASGDYSLSTLAKVIYVETGRRIPRANIHWILKNPFYAGSFEWGGQAYRGSHTLFVNPHTYRLAREVLAGRRHAKQFNQSIAFRRLMRCAYDGCVLTGDVKKAKYVYYYCTGSRGRCRLPRFREQEMVERLGEMLKGLQVSRCLAGEVISTLQSRWGSVKGMKARAAELGQRMDRAYADKLDGKVPEEFWRRNMDAWWIEQQRLKAAIDKAVGTSASDVATVAEKTFRLVEHAQSLYLSHSDPHEKAKLLRVFFSDCVVDADGVTPTYKRPFDLIQRKASIEEWAQYFATEV